MGWEQRHGRLYYYRKRREGRTVVSEYVPASLATVAAVLDDEERAERQAQRADLLREREVFRQADEATEQALALARVLAAEALRAAGYYQHKGQWRKRRE